jgi:5-methylcytosine-specific restriction protein A
MPMASPRPCLSPGCSQLVRGASRCPKHQAKVDDARRTRIGYSSPRWRRERAAFLGVNPLCCICGTAKADTVDHRPPHREDPVKFWDQSTWRPCCASCHSRTTATMDGGWGHG